MITEETKTRIREAVTEALTFDKLVVYSIVGILLVVLMFSFTVVLYMPYSEQTVQYILSFFKDISLIIVGALANSIKGHSKRDH